MPVKQCMTTYVVFALIASICLSTQVTFYVDHQVQQPLDQVQINAIIKVNDNSLETAIQKASQIIQNIQNAVNQYCKSITPKDKQKQECKDLFQASAYSIKPQYQLLKKKQLFAGFIVAQQIQINVKESPNFGQLVDDILKIGVSKINSLQWKPKEEVDGEEIAVQQGLVQAKAICQKLGASLGKVLSVQQVTDFGQQQAENQNENQDDQEEQEEDEQQQPVDIKEGFVYYKFVVDCVRQSKK